MDIKPKIKNIIGMLKTKDLKVPSEGNLGIPRRNMPQIKKKHFDKFIKWLSKKGIETSNETIAANKLKATQKDFDLRKVTDILNNDTEKNKEKLKKAILISKDNYILDGHHKWLAHLNIDESKKIKVVRVDMKAKDFLEASKEFSKVKYEDTEGNRYKYINPKMKSSNKELVMNNDLIKKVREALNKKSDESFKVKVQAQFTNIQNLFKPDKINFSEYEDYDYEPLEIRWDYEVDLRSWGIKSIDFSVPDQKLTLKIRLMAEDNEVEVEREVFLKDIKARGDDLDLTDGIKITELYLEVKPDGKTLTGTAKVG